MFQTASITELQLASSAAWIPRTLVNSKLAIAAMEIENTPYHVLNVKRLEKVKDVK